MATDHPNGTHLAPKVRGLSVKLTSPAGLAYFAARSGFRYFVTGQPVIGGPRDNATLLYDATQAYGNHPSPRLTRARWRRVARRNAVLGVPGGLLSMEGVSAVVRAPMDLIGATPPGWTEVPWWTLAEGYACVAVAGTVAYLVPRARSYYATRELNREYVYPTWREVCQILGRRYDAREARRMIELPAGFGADVEPGTQPVPVRVTLPPVVLDPGVTKRLDRIGARLGMPGAVVEAHAIGSATFLDVAPAALPPRRVKLETLRAIAESADVDRPVLGATNGGGTLELDYNNDSPHIAVSAGSGAGKSNTIAWIESQRMRHGVFVVILDLKKWSHDWAHGLPTSRAAYLYKIAKIHDGLVALGDELMRRVDMDDRAELARMRRIDVVVEEANTLLPALNAYWREERARIKAANRAALQDDPYADVTEPPLSSPAVQAIGAIVGMGREFSMHKVFSGQKLSASTFGGPAGDRRESFKIRLLGAWDKGLWNMLAKGVPYVPCPKEERGIWCCVTGGQATIVRVPQVIDKVDTRTYQDTLRAWVLDSPEPDRPALLDTSAFLSITSGDGVVRVRPADTVDTGGADVVDVPAQRVTLSAAVDKLPGQPVTLKILRHAADRDSRFPEPAVVGGPGRPNLYELPALVEWKARRDETPEDVG